MNVHDLGAASLIAFATTTFLMNITPGPAVMQVVGLRPTESRREGSRATAPSRAPPAPLTRVRP